MIKENVLVIRTISSIVMLFFFLLMIFSNDLIFLILFQVILFLANWELLRLIEFKKKFYKKTEKTNFFLSRFKIRINDYILIILINFFTFFFFYSLTKFQIIVFFLIILFCWKNSDKDFVKYFSILYVSSSFLFLTYLRELSDFVNIILFIVIFGMMVDISALLIGKTFGGPKIFPNISPNKTYSGSVGGLIVPVILCIIFFKDDQNFNNIVISSIILSLVAQSGDLIESKLKRYCFVKDSSNLIPGHGGVLDRLDSFMLLIIFVSIMNLFDYNFFFIV